MGNGVRMVAVYGSSMNQSSFESEYDDEHVRSFLGEPKVNSEIKTLSDAEVPWTQMSTLLQETVLKAVQNFYLAKKFRQNFSGFSGNGEQPDRVARTIANIEMQLWRMAVIDVAGINDQSASDASRAASLPQALMRMRSVLKALGAPAAADLERLEDIRSSINAANHQELLYVRHLRNKWAGHPSLDRRFDDWAEADTSVHLPVVEAALVRLVRGCQAAADLADASDHLTAFRQPQSPSMTVGKPYPMTFNPSNVTLLADVMRDSVRQDVRAVRAQFTAQTMVDRVRLIDAFDGPTF